MAHHFFGKYRSIVVNNIDPMMLGRIVAEVPAVPEMVASFAMPCVPYAGQNVGFYAIPPIGANVWIEFEGGDPTKPIWSGCFWGPGQVPPAAVAQPGTQVFQTDSVSIVFSGVDAGGGFSLTCNPAGAAGPVTLQCNSQGISISYSGNVMALAQDSITLSSGTSRLSIDTSVISVNATELKGNFNAAIVQAGMIEIEGSMNLQGAVAIEGPTILVGGLNLTGGGTVDGKPLP